MIRPRPEMDDTQLRPSAARFILSRSPKALSATALVGKTKELFSLPCSLSPLSRFTLMLDVNCRKNDGAAMRWNMEVVEMAPDSLSVGQTPNSSWVGGECNAGGAEFYDRGRK